MPPSLLPKNDPQPAPAAPGTKLETKGNSPGPAADSPEINPIDKSVDKPLGNTAEVAGSSGLHPNVPARPPQNLPPTNPLPRPNAEARSVSRTESLPAAGTVDPRSDAGRVGKLGGIKHPDERPSITPAVGTGAETDADRRAVIEEHKKQNEIADRTDDLRKELGHVEVPIRDISRHNSLLQEQAQLQAMLDSKPGNKRLTVIGPEGVAVNATLQRDEDQTRPKVSLTDSKTPSTAQRVNV